MRHQGFVLATLFSADGRRLYSASVEGAVNVWAVDTGELLHSWPCHAGPIRDLARSADGSRLFTASKDGTIGVWDGSTGKIMHRLAGPGAGFFCVATWGDFVAGGSLDGTIQMWNAKSAEQITTLRGHTEAVTSVAFLSPSRLVSGSRDCTLKVWPVDAEDRVRTLHGHRHWVTKVAALPDGRSVLSVGEDGTVKRWDYADSRITWSRTLDGTPPIWGLAVNEAGTLAIAGAAGQTTRWDAASGEQGAQMDRSAFAHRALSISPDGSVAGLGGDDGHIVIHDLNNARDVCTLAGEGLHILSNAAGTRDDHVASGQASGAITLHAGAGRQAAHGFFVYTMCRVDETRFASGALDGWIHVWDFAGGTRLQSFEHDGEVFAVAASGDGGRLLSAGGDMWRLWDLATGAQMSEVVGIGSGSHTVGDLAADGSRIVSAGEDDCLRVWSAEGELIGTIGLPRTMTCAVRYLPDSRCALIGSAYGFVSLVDLENGQSEVLHLVHEDWIRGLHVSPDGRFVLSVSQECDCAVYDLAERRLCTPEKLTGLITAATFAPSGTIAAITTSGEVVHAATLA